MITIIDKGRLVVELSLSNQWYIIRDAPCGCNIISMGPLYIEWLGDECLEVKSEERDGKI